MSTRIWLLVKAACDCALLGRNYKVSTREDVTEATMGVGISYHLWVQIIFPTTGTDASLRTRLQRNCWCQWFRQEQRIRRSVVRAWRTA